MSRGSDTIFTEIINSFQTVNDHFIEEKQRNKLFGLNANDLKNTSNQDLLALVCNPNTFTTTTGMTLKQGASNITGNV
jgi:riboflavin synthase